MGKDHALYAHACPIRAKVCPIPAKSLSKPLTPCPRRLSENRTCKDIVFQETSTISRHVKDAFESGKLIPDSTVAFFATVQNEGGRKLSRDLAYYNLDMIISVGYRVHSLRGVQLTNS